MLASCVVGNIDLVEHKMIDSAHVNKLLVGGKELGLFGDFGRC